MADTTIDLMEYSSDALAQAAYVTNDTYDAYTKAASHFDGADAATAYTDPIAGAYTFYGTAQLDTAQKVFGTASLLLDGNSDYVTLPDSANWVYGTSPFTIEGRFRFNGDPGTAVEQWLYCQMKTGGDAGDSMNIYLATNNKLVFNAAAGGSDRTKFSCPFDPADATWYHIAVVRVNTDNAATGWRIFINGVSQTLTLTAGAWNATMPDIAGLLYLGERGVSGIYFFNGWIDEFRVSNGIARWTADFTLPTEPYPNDLYVKSESTIKTQGDYSLKAVAAATDSLNKTLTRTIT